MPKVMENLRIRAVSAALPHARTTLADVGQLFNDRDVQRIARNAGIEQVYPAGHLTMIDLCAAAARQLMEDSNIAPASIDALVVGTQSDEKSLLASSSDLARRLGLRTDVVVFDLSCTCNCYIYGLYQAAMLVTAGGCKRVLMCTGDVISELLTLQRHGMKLVLGNAATCTLVEQGDDELAFDFDTGVKPAPLVRPSLAYTDLEADRASRQDSHARGEQLINFAFEKVPHVITRFLASRQQKIEDVPYFLLHQASDFMLHYLARKLGVAPEKIPKELPEAGQAGPSSIPLMVTQYQQKQDMQQNHLIACGFGSGLSVSVCRLSLGHADIHAPVYVHAP